MNPWYLVSANAPDTTFSELASAHTNKLTKPNGSLGALESIAITLAGMQATKTPSVNRISICIFAADHGVADEAVSAFPQAVTAEMVRNFSKGGAAISVLAKQLQAQFQVINVGTVQALEPLAFVSDQRIAAGTNNFVNAAAMDNTQLLTALTIGKNTIESLSDSDCFIGGEMGIANTTSAAALACALLAVPAEQLVGRGTGVSTAIVMHKALIIEKALKQNSSALNNPLTVLQSFGGFEIAALVGAYIRAGQQSLPVLVDGFICSVAALVAVRINPSIRPWLIFSHLSDEAGHQLVLAHLQAQPLLTLAMRLGEASGAAVAVPLLRMACALHNEMSSFESAGVSNNLEKV